MNSLSATANERQDPSFRWQLCAGPEGGCAQAAENRYGTQPPDDVPSSRVAVLKKAFPRDENPLTLTVMSHTAIGERRSRGSITRKPRAYLKKILAYYLVQHMQQGLFPVKSMAKSL